MGDPLEEWVSELGVTDKPIILMKPSKRVALVLSSIVCRNINTRYSREAVVYGDYLGIAGFLGECGCNYKLTHDRCRADIIMLKQFSKRMVCGHPHMIVAGWTRGFQGHDIFDTVFFVRTVKPNQYVVDINNIKFLVRLSKCSIETVVLTEDRKALLGAIRQSMNEYGYLTEDIILRVISSFYDITKSRARIIMNEMAEEGLLLIEKNHIEIPYYK
jgi:hypothetical protein